jgi:hypothetical protein
MGKALDTKSVDWRLRGGFVDLTKSGPIVPCIRLQLFKMSSISPLLRRWQIHGRMLLSLPRSQTRPKQLTVGCTR